MRLLTAGILALLAAQAASCGGGGGGGGNESDSPDLPNVPVALYPATSYVVVSKTISLQVYGSIYGKPLGPLDWESGDTAVATVNSLGKVAGVSAGQATIAASLVSDPSSRVTATVIVVPSAEETEILGVGPRVNVYPYAGGTPSPLQSPDLDGCRGIAAGPGGKIYVLAGWSIWCVDMLAGGDPTLVKAFATQAADPAEGFGNMGSLAIDSAGRLYTVGFATRSPGDVILRVDPSDGSVTQFAEVPYTLSLVAGLDVDSDNNVYALGGLFPASLVTRFSPDGTATNVLPNYGGDDMGQGLCVVGDGKVIYAAFQHSDPGAFANYGIYRCTNLDADPEYEDVTCCADGFGNIGGVFWTKDGLLVNGSETPSPLAHQIFRLKDTNSDGLYAPAERSVWSSQPVDGNSSRSVFARLNPW